MTFFATTEALAGGARGTGLHRSVVGRSLSWCLLTTLLLRTFDYQSAAGLGCAEDTDHDSTD